MAWEGSWPTESVRVILIPIVKPTTPPESIWREYRRLARPIILGGLLFVTAVSFLIIGFVGLKVARAFGYPSEQIDLLEHIDFITIAVVTILFAYDTIMKIWVIVTSRRK